MTGNSTRSSSPRRRPSTTRSYGYARPCPAPCTHPDEHARTPPARASTPSRASHSPAPRVAPSPAQHVGGGWGWGEARQEGLLEGWAGAGLRGGRGSGAPLTAAPRCGALAGVDRGRPGDAAAATLCACLCACFVQGCVGCVPVCLGRGWGPPDLFVFAFSMCFPPLPAPVSAHVHVHVNLTSISSIYVIAMCVCHPPTRPMTRVDGPDRFEPSRGGYNSISERPSLAAGPALAQGGVTMTRLRI